MAARLFHLLCLVEDSLAPVSRSPEELAEQAVELLTEPIHAAMNVNELADTFRVSRTTLFHAFRKRFGCAPAEKVTEIRMERARKLLLENPNLTVGAVARMAAFENVKYFIRAFRKNYGMPPGRFRKTYGSESR
ncbi:HTH-type transcriptional regulator YesS [bioreactor metagenome]|uniref:HTH-type transcriptional regulator YesS n=1 Tax=bioreactor metagenome TaxID=1076179 RepID=A0A645JGI3_9ZZZZ